MLTRYDQNDLELIINQETGEVFASQSALARMVERNESTIRDWLTSRNIQGEEAEILTSTGLKTSRLLNEDTIHQAFAKYKHELLIPCSKAGIRVYLHGLAGFATVSTAVTTPTDYQKLWERQNGVAPAKRHSVVDYTQAAKDIPTLAVPGAIKQLLLDMLGDELATLKGTPVLPPASSERWLGASQKAEELGYSMNTSNRVKLGKYLKKQGLMPKKEMRLCNGQMRPINCYPDTPQLSEAIEKFFN